MFESVGKVSLLLIVVLMLAGCPPQVAAPDGGSGAMAEAEGPIEIEYWQYNFGARVDAMDQLIEMFEEENPDIKVVHNSEIPYADFRDKIAVSVPAGVGPDVATMFYGWQLDWIAADYVVPLPEDEFPPSILDEFSPMVQASRINGQLYTLPTAVRSLALFYNKDLMEAAGLDPESPPQTLTELEEQAVQCTQREGDSYLVHGFIANPGGQGHHWFRQVLLPQFGQQPLSDDRQTVQWNASEEGYAAWNQFLKFETELETGATGVYENDPDGFLAGEVCFHVDGSFRLGTIANNAPDLNFGVTELPEHNGVKATFGSYWTHGITQKGASDPARLAASAKFLKFISSPEAGALWVGIVGELPAQLSAAEDANLLADEKLGAFAQGLSYAQATFFINESDDRQAIIDAHNAVILNGADPNAELDFAVETVQTMYDEYWADQ
ncbi:extracellular solute-binding protein [Chloroflexi bacterium TSY]|nr:extracellular solute-binding protein [Chloroflexi bacterium TSY]